MSVHFEDRNLLSIESQFKNISIYIKKISFITSDVL